MAIPTIQCNIIVEFTLMGMGRLMDFLNECFTPSSEVFLKNVLCIVSKVVHETGMPIAALTVMWIALERLLATILIKSYEKKTSTIGVRITITVYICSFIASLGGVAYDTLLTNTFSVTTSRFSCQTINLHPYFFPGAWVLCVVGYISSNILLICLYKYNKRKKEVARGVPLSARYQYAENVATLRVIVPAVCAYGVAVLFGVLTFPQLIVAWDKGDRDEELFINQLLYLYPAFNSVVCPLAFALRYPPLNYAMKADLASWMSCTRGHVTPRSPVYVATTANVVEEGDIHFKQMDELWGRIKVAA
ncbi:hypothetical protein AAVH_17367 [Aphelenchoides avenae]|nr:hypothetical protein AAVH_17367 [Aphelenchus avenae]